MMDLPKKIRGFELHEGKMGKKYYCCYRTYGIEDVDGDNFLCLKYGTTAEKAREKVQEFLDDNKIALERNEPFWLLNVYDRY